MSDLQTYLRALRQTTTFDFSEVKKMIFREFAGAYIDDVTLALRVALLRNPEVQAYPKLASLLVQIVREVCSEEEGFFDLSGISFGPTLNLLTVPPDLSRLGSYGDFMAGKVAGGGNETGTPTSASGWRGIYIKFQKGEKSKYPQIMQRRLYYWQATGVAPYWYWLDTDSSVNEDLAYPKRRGTIYLKDIFSVAAKRLLASFKIEEAEITTKIDVELYSEDLKQALFAQTEIPEPTDRKYVVVAYKGKPVTIEEVERKLASGEWRLTKEYTRTIGGNVVYVQQVYAITTKGARFTGVYLGRQ